MKGVDNLQLRLLSVSLIKTWGSGTVMDVLHEFRKVDKDVSFEVTRRALHQAEVKGQLVLLEEATNKGSKVYGPPVKL